MADPYAANGADEQGSDQTDAPQRVGPFVTISRQFGCQGFSLGLLLMEILNDEAPPDKTWKIYHREILERLATETNMAAELVERETYSRPRLFVDFFRSLRIGRSPSGQELRKRVATLVRGLAVDGYAIIIGQGGAGVTHDLPNGLWVRLEAPEDYRVRQVALREGLTALEARRRVAETEKQRETVRQLYHRRFPRQPSFHLIYDASAFTLTQIAQHIVHAMKFRGMI